LNRLTEIELKFQVPATALSGISTELKRITGAYVTQLVAEYLDTDDRRLARQGIAWRLRREGRLWKQTLKAGGAHSLERFEHDVARPDATFDASLHAGTEVGDRLLKILRKARAEGFETNVRYRTEVRRTARAVRTRGAVVEIALDQGRLVSKGSVQRIREIEFELKSGSIAAMLALVERWRKRFGLILDPHSKAERGDRLADGVPFPPLRKGERLKYPADATATEAFAAIMEECLNQITRNAAGLVVGEIAQVTERVHQLRVGIRRLRSALRCFQDWSPAPPAHLVDGLRSLFATLGESRDSAVLDTGVARELIGFGAPQLAMPPGGAGPNPVDAVKSAQTQQLLLAWITWRATLESATVQPDDLAAATDDSAASLHDEARRLLRRWHRRIAADWKAFDALDETQLHALRKRIKRQRYAVEFLAPVLPRRRVERYLSALAVIQDRMGYLNDLFVARGQYQRLVESEPAAWFALGWLSARIAEVRALAKPELGELSKAGPP
jgi:triphosphatase